VIYTRYTPATVGLLVLGGAVCGFNVFLAIMTAGFGADPVHDFKSGAIVACILLALTSLPIYLAMFRWAGIGCVAMWSATVGCFLLSLFVGAPGMAFSMFLFVQSLVCQGIKSASEKAYAANQTDRES